MSDESEKSDPEDQCHKDPDTDDSDHDYTEATWEAPPMSQTMKKRMELSQKEEKSNINAEFVSSLSRISRSPPPIPPKSLKGQIDPVKQDTSPEMENDMEVVNFRNKNKTSPENDQIRMSVKDRARMFEQPQNNPFLALKQPSSDSANVQISIAETSQTENSSDIYSSTKELEIKNQLHTGQTSPLEESSDQTLLKHSHSEQTITNQSQMDEGKGNVQQNEEQVKNSSDINSSAKEIESNSLSEQQISPSEIEENSHLTELKHSDQTFTNQTQMEEGTDKVLPNQEQERNHPFQNQHPIKQQYPGPRSVHGWPGTPPAPQMHYAQPGYHGQPHIRNPRYDPPYQRNPGEFQYHSLEPYEMWQGHWQPPPQQFGQASPQQFGQHPHHSGQPPHQHFGPLPPQQFGQTPHQHFQQPQQFGQIRHQQFQQPQQFGQTSPHGLPSGQGLQNTKRGETSHNESSGKPHTRPGTNPPKSNQSSTPQGGKKGGKGQTPPKIPGDVKKETLKPEKDRRSEAATGAKGKSQPTKGPEKMYVCVDGIDNEESNDTVFNYLEGRSKVDVIVEESLRTTENPEHAVVVFADRVELKSLEQACASKKLKTSRMTFEELDPPRTVIVSSEDDGLTENKLQDHLKKKKIDTVRVHTTDEGEISVKLKNTEGVIEILKSTNMKIDGSKIVISVTYYCDHGTYWDHSLHRVAIPTPYKPAHLDEHVKGFLIDITSTCNEHLEQYHACLTISDEIHIKCTIDPKDQSARSKVKVWKDSVEKAWQEFISSNVQKRELKVTSDTKDLLKEHINKTKEEHKSEELKVIYEDNKMTIIFVGKSNIVENFHEKVSTKKTEIQDNLNRKNRMKTDSMNLKPIEIALMLKCNEFEQLSKIASDLSYHLDEENGTITLTGVQEDIDKAKVIIFETKNHYHIWNVTNMSVCQCRLLSNPTLSDLMYEKLKDNNITAIFEIEQSKIVVCGTSENHCKKVEKFLKEAILEDKIHLDVTSKNVLQLDEWTEKKASIEKNFPHFVNIDDSTDDAIVVTAWSDVLENIMDELEQLILEHSIYEEDINIRDEAELKFLKIHCKDVIADLQYQNKDLNIKFDKQSVKVTGTKKAITEACDEIKGAIRKITKNPHTISRPGVDSLFDNQNKCEALINPIEEESQTVIIVDQKSLTTPHKHKTTAPKETDEDYTKRQGYKDFKRKDTRKKGESFAVKSGPVVYKNGTKIILVKKEELGQQVADVLVCSTNGQLDLSGGAGKNLVKVAGNEILDEIKAKYGAGINHGEIAVVKGYKLRCKEVYLTALSNWKLGGEKVISKCINTCLLQASSSKYKSLVFPALGTGNFHYPRDLIAHTMYKCVKKFDASNTTLKEIKFLCYDEETIKAFQKEENNQLNPGYQPKPTYKASTGGPYKKHSITMTVVKGDLGQQKVDVMLSAAPQDLNLEKAGGAAMSLVKAFPNIQTDIASQHPKGVTSGALAAVKLSTPAGSCQAVYLTSLDSWNQEKLIQKDSDKQIYKFVYSCLERAEKDGYKSIGIPAMGTGKIGYPHDLVAKYMYDVVEKFADSNKNSKVTDVKFVVHYKDAESIKAFYNEESQRIPVVVPPPTAHHGFASLGSSDDSTSIKVKATSDNEFEVGKLKFSVEKGDILVKKCDAIVNGSNSDFDLNTGAVSKALKQKCNTKQLEDECEKKKKDMKKYGVVSTSGCGLPASYIIHISSKNNPNEWKEIIVKALYKAEKKQLKTIAFPAIGTGAAGSDEEQMGRTIMESLVEFVGEGKTTHLQHVYLVIFMDKMVQPMLKGVRAGGQNVRSAKPGQVIQSDDNKTWSVSFTIYSMSKDASTEAKKMLDKAVEEKYRTEHHRDLNISELNENEIQLLKSVGNNYPIKMTIDQTRSDITMEGILEDITNAKQEIFDCLRKFAHTRHCKAEAKIIQEQVQWYLKDMDTGVPKLIEYPDMINMYLETAYKGESGRTEVEFKDDQGEEYVIVLKEMTEYLKKDRSNKVDVLRREKVQGGGGTFEPPPEWDEQGTDNVKVVTLQNTSLEYQSVEQKFINSVFSGKPQWANQFNKLTLKVTKIERIQNLSLYHMYAAKKALLDKQNPTGTVNEKDLWHGTPEKSVVSINFYGFNRSYCRDNSKDAYWGDGVYFSDDASYSARGWLAAGGTTGEQNIYLCKVLTGVQCAGVRGMRYLPFRPDGTMLNYDSATDNLKPPVEYVIFNDTQAYPKYCIKFKT